ncbi:hypothetical protein FRC07_005108 [Ceratobasidium sp. 392]|nr:hypothetical protein FRC07_005108 [Ceratobasidium sp. 392]
MAEDVHYINQPPSHLDSGHESLVEGDNRTLEEEEEDIGLVAWTGSSSSTEYGALEDETTSMSDGLEPSSPEEPWECDDETRDTLQVTKALGDLYHDRFKHLKQIFDIDMAIELYNQVISLLPEGTRRGLEPMIRLSKSYHLRYEHLGRLDDLQAAIDCHNRALPLVPEYNDLDKQKLLGNLGSLHCRRFEHLKNLEDLTESIRYLNDALNLAAEDPSNKPILLNSLGASYHSHFNVSGELESLTNAVAVQTQAVSLVSDDDPNKCVLLNDLGISHISLFKRLEQSLGT